LEYECIGGLSPETGRHGKCKHRQESAQTGRLGLQALCQNDTCPCTKRCGKKRRVDELIRAIVAEQSEHELSILFVDESHFANEPYVQRGWQRERVKKKVAQPTKRESKTIFGALHLHSQRFYWKQASKGNAKTFMAFLYQLHQSFPEKLLVLILDNCSIHQSKKVKKFVAATSWLELKHLAPYSPEYNPIERFWRWLKTKVYGCKSFQTMEEVMGKMRKLIWHYNEGWLVATIRFNFNAYARIL
jgi:transposase